MIYYVILFVLFVAGE